MNGTSGCCSTWTTAACPHWTRTATSCRCSSLRPPTVTPPSTCWPPVAGCRRPPHHRGRPRRRLGRAIAGQPAGDPRWPHRRRPTLGRATPRGAAATCWSSKWSPRPDSGPDTTRPRGSACGRCRNSICVAHACWTSAPAPACSPSPPYAWVQPRHSASTTTPMRSSRPRTRCAATAARRPPSRMELRGLDDPALLPCGRGVREPHRCAAPPAGRARAGAAGAGRPRRAQRLHRGRGPLGPRRVRRLRRRGDARRRVLGRLRVATAADTSQA